MFGKPIRRTRMSTRLNQGVVAIFDCSLKLVSSSDRSKAEVLLEYDGLAFAVVTTTSNQHHELDYMSQR
jgi:hypothetical protein